MKTPEDIYWDIYCLIRDIERTDISRDNIRLALAKMLVNQSLDSKRYNFLHECLLVYTNDYRDFFNQYFHNLKIEKDKDNNEDSVSAVWYLIKNEFIKDRPLDERQELYWFVLSNVKSLKVIASLLTKAVHTEDEKVISFLEDKMLDRPIDKIDYEQMHNFVLSLFKYSHDVAFNFVNRLFMKIGFWAGSENGSVLRNLREIFEKRAKVADECAHNKINHFPVSTERRLRLGVIVTGQLRGYENAFESWKNMGIYDHDTDFYVHVWKDVGRVDISKRNYYANRYFGPALGKVLLAHYQNNWEALFKNYPHFCSLYADNKVYAESESLKQFYNTDNIIIEDDHEPQFSSWNNMRKMFYKMHNGFQMLEKSGKEYDAILWMRPDVIIHDYPFNLMEMTENSAKNGVVYLDYGPKCTGNKQKDWDWRVPIAGHLYAFGAYGMMKRYFSMFEMAEANEKDNLYFGYDGFKVSHEPLFMALVLQGVGIEAAHPRYDFCDIVPSRESLLEAVQKDISAREAIPSDNPVLEALNA